MRKIPELNFGSYLHTHTHTVGKIEGTVAGKIGQGQTWQGFGC